MSNQTLLESLTQDRDRCLERARVAEAKINQLQQVLFSVKKGAEAAAQARIHSINMELLTALSCLVALINTDAKYDETSTMQSARAAIAKAKAATQQRTPQMSESLQAAQRLVIHLKAAGEKFEDEEYVIHEIHQAILKARQDALKPSK